MSLTCSRSFPHGVESGGLLLLFIYLFLCKHLRSLLPHIQRDLTNPLFLARGPHG